MTEWSIEDLLKRPESPTLDFKRDKYDFGGVKHESLEKRIVFAKDVICMANTPRTESAFIVLGAKKNVDGTMSLPGIPSHFDDAFLQDQLNGLVHPHPAFIYSQAAYEGKQFGVIEIRTDRSQGPFYPTKSLAPDFLRPNLLYFRRGSVNSEANSDEQKWIHDWFAGRTDKPLLSSENDSAWSQVLGNLQEVTNGSRLVLLSAPSQSAPPDAYSHLGVIDWQFVVDLDPSSDDAGVLHHCRAQLEPRRSIHRVTLGDSLTGNLRRSTTWYFAKGLAGRSSSIKQDGWAEWLKSYGRDLREKFVAFGGAVSAPILLVAIWDSDESSRYINKCIETAIEVFGDALRVMVITEDKTSVEKYLEADAQVIRISIRHFLEGLSAWDRGAATISTRQILLPGRDGVRKELTPQDWAWIEEDLELLHLSTGAQLSPDSQPCTEFLKGVSIPWFDLGVGCDVERDKRSHIEKAVRRDLDQRHNTRVNLFHRPGAGGTTIARRLAWNIHHDFPVALLRRCSAKETVERIEKLYSTSERSVLVVREGGDVSDSEADALAGLLAARQIPSVLLQVLRRHTKEIDRERVFFVDSILSTLETERFRAVLKKELGSRGREIDRIATGSAAERTPFLFGLAAFAEDYKGLGPYVLKNLNGIPETQISILTTLAIAHAYGQQPVSEQHFATLVGVPRNRRVDLRKALSPQALTLLVEVGAGKWRTSHHLVAREIIKKLLSRGLPDERNWQTRLADTAIQFAEFCASEDQLESQEIDSLISRVFYYRDDSELLGTVKAGERLFSEMIQEIPAPEGRLRVLKRLVELFPTQAHYWAHLCRFYTIQLRQFEDARNAIDRAIELRPQDHLLQHMKGMAIRGALYERISKETPLDEILPLAREASDCFERARSLAPEDEHGYISEAQMVTRVLDYAQRLTGTDAVIVAATHEDSWLREAFQRAEELLRSVRHDKFNETPSEYEERCRAELDLLYGSHEQALQRWQNLLDRRDSKGESFCYAPPIRRQIVWTLLSRRRRRWENLQPTELRRAVELLEQNVAEEPQDDRNVRLWVQSARYLADAPTLDAAIERVAYWKSLGNSLDAIYYLATLYSLQALQGSLLAGEKAMRALEECRQKARFRRDRTRSFEWLSDGMGLQQLVHQERLGEWHRDSNFWTNSDPLKRVNGVIAAIAGPQAGEIEVSGGIRAFFVPGPHDFAKGRSENRKVTFFMGFSYDGPRAWSVRLDNS
jgi:hypothetical protein